MRNRIARILLAAGIALGALPWRYARLPGTTRAPDHRPRGRRAHHRHPGARAGRAALGKTLGQAASSWRTSRAPPAISPPPSCRREPRRLHAVHGDRVQPRHQPALYNKKNPAATTRSALLAHRHGGVDPRWCWSPHPKKLPVKSVAELVALCKTSRGTRTTPPAATARPCTWRAPHAPTRPT